MKRDQAPFHNSFVPAGYKLNYQRPAVQNCTFNSQTSTIFENEDVQTLSTTLRLPVFRMLRIIPPARLATATDEDTRRIKNFGDPAAMIAGGSSGHVKSSHDKRCVMRRKVGRVGRGSPF